MPDDPKPEDGVQWLTANSDALSEQMRVINEATAQVQQQLERMRAKGDAINISDMFELQMSMNKLSQLSEMSAGIVSATNSAIASMARNVKG